LSGPFRVAPGRLSVSRTIGDIEAKDKRYGGNPEVVVPTPDIISFKIKSNYDFIALGCDGVFEKQSNTDIVQSVWKAYSPDTKTALIKGSPDAQRTLHSKAGDGIDRLLHGCVEEKTLDNVTAVLIGFKHLEELIEKGYRHSFQKVIPESLMESEDL
jgi:protein phosphatase PTC2/3